MNGQIHTYDQFINDKKVGTLTVNKVQSPDSIAFTIYSEVLVDLWLSKVKVIYDAEVHYSKQRMTRSSVRILKNGNLRDLSKTWIEGGEYRALVEGEERTLPWDAIEFSSLLMYIQEPVGRDSVYAEVDGMKNALKYKGNGRYHMEVTTNNNENEYYYTDGLLTKAKLDHWLAPIHLRIQEE